MLDELPESSDVFWKHSKKKKIEEGKKKKCEHNFVHETGNSVYCTKCFAGFNLTQGFRVEDGKILFKDKVVI